MTLTTHGVVGATIVTLIPNDPILGLGLAFSSHFLVDAIPHWDYPLASMDKEKERQGVVEMKLGRAFIKDLFFIGLDFAVGLVLAFFVSLFFIGEVSWLVLLGAFLAMLPDGLQFLYGKFRWRILSFIQRFHVWIHTNHKMIEKPWLGVFTQVLFVVFVIVLRFTFNNFL